MFTRSVLAPLIRGTFLSTWVAGQIGIGGKQVITLIPQSRGYVQQQNALVGMMAVAASAASAAYIAHIRIHTPCLCTSSQLKSDFTPFVTSQKE